MTLESSMRNMDDESIRSAASFWETRADASALIDRITDTINLLKKTSSLSREERGILLRLLTADGALTRGDVALQPGSATTLESLVERFFAYVRMDRALLTNRTDKIYLYPEVADTLTGVPLLETTRFLAHIGDVTGSMEFALLSAGEAEMERRAVPRGAGSRAAMLSLVKMGGFVDFGGRVDDFLSLIEQKLAEPLLVHDTETLVPVLAVRGGHEDVPGDAPEIHYGQSLYLSHLLKISDCLSYRRLDRRHFTKTFTACVKSAAPAAPRERYQEDLEALGVIDMSGENPSVSRRFVSLSFPEQVRHVESLLSRGEEEALARVREWDSASRVSLVASLAAEKTLDLLFRGDRIIEGAMPLAGLDVENSIETLLFRGYLVADQSGAFVKINDLHDRTAGKGSVILNNDLEIVAFPELISYRALNLLACFSDLVDCRETVRLRVSRESVLRGISLFGDVERFLETVETCSRVPIARTVVDTVTGWAASYASVGMERRIVITIPSREAGMKLLHNTYIRKHVDEESDGMLVFREDTDFDRLTREIRKENVFIDPRTPESPSFRDPPASGI